MNAFIRFCIQRIHNEGLISKASPEVQYSIAYCQGDGLAFNHEKQDALITDALLSLSERYFRGAGEVRFAVRRAIRKCQPSFQIRNPRHGHHPSSMVVEYELADEDLLSVEEAAAMDSLRVAVEAHARSLAGELYRDGHEVFLSSPYEPEMVREFRTRRYRLTIEHYPCDIDTDDYLDEYDIALLAGGDHEVVDLRVKLYARTEEDEDELLADDSLYGFMKTKGTDTRHYGGELRGLIGNVCDEARRLGIIASSSPDVAKAA